MVAFLFCYICEKITKVKFFIQVILFLLFTIVSFSALAQKDIRGTVIDRKTKQVLPFVNIVYYSTTKLGTTTDLDGRFQIHSNSNITSLEISFMGYKTRSIQVSNLENINSNFKIFFCGRNYLLAISKRRT